MVELRERTGYVQRPKRKRKLNGEHVLMLRQPMRTRVGNPGVWILMAKECFILDPKVRWMRTENPMQSQELPRVALKG